MIIKKLISIIYFVFAAIGLWSIIDCLFMPGGWLKYMPSDISSAGSVGTLFGMLLSLIMCLLAGIYFLIEVKVKNGNYVKAFKKRDKLNVLVVILMVFFLLTYIIAMINPESFMDDRYNYSIVKFLLILVIYIILIFPLLLEAAKYVDGGKARVKSGFGLSNEQQAALLCESKLVPIEGAPEILVNNKAIFFKDNLCAIPVDKILWIYEKKMLVERYIYFMTDNKKKVPVFSFKYEALLAFINSHPGFFRQDLIIGEGKEQKERYRALTK